MILSVGSVAHPWSPDLITMNPLPPQAYTKDTLLKAYQWLMGQDASIKDIATGPDILVSLYLKALRDGDSALERPSIQNFKNELKSLAGIMGELDRSQTTPTATSTPQKPSTSTQSTTAHVNIPVQQTLQPTHIYQPAVQTPPMVHTSSTATSAMTAPPMASMGSQTHVSYTEKTMTATAQNLDISAVLDPKSMEMLSEIRAEFNLSSEIEALRMLIKVGYSRSRDLLK